MHKKLARLRRAKKTRLKAKELNVPRLCVNRSLNHLYAQIILNSPQGDVVVASASTLDKQSIQSGAQSSNIKAAAIIGKMIAQRALEKGIKQIAYDRSGYKYHGVIKALAEAAREAGLQF